MDAFHLCFHLFCLLRSEEVTHSSSWQTQLMVPLQERISGSDFLALVPHVRPGILKI